VPKTLLIGSGGFLGEWDLRKFRTPNDNPTDNIFTVSAFHSRGCLTLLILSKFWEGRDMQLNLDSDMDGVLDARRKWK
jgi:hypothetical protein